MQFVFRSARSLAKQMRDARAVLFDHAGTLVRDSPGSGALRLPVEPMPGAVEAVERIRAARMPVGVVGIGSAACRAPVGVAVRSQVEAVFGRFDAWRCCPHLPGEPCDCRRQAPELLLEAAKDLDVAPHEVVVVGDVGPDVRAAQACGAVGILVPSPHTLRAECIGLDLRSAGSLASRLGCPPTGGVTSWGPCASVPSAFAHDVAIEM